MLFADDVTMFYVVITGDNNENTITTKTKTNHEHKHQQHPTTKASVEDNRRGRVFTTLHPSQNVNMLLSDSRIEIILLEYWNTYRSARLRQSAHL